MDVWFVSGLLEPVDRIELSTYGLRNRCSTTELHRRIRLSECPAPRWTQRQQRPIGKRMYAAPPGAKSRTPAPMRAGKALAAACYAAGAVAVHIALLRAVNVAGHGK